MGLIHRRGMEMCKNKGVSYFTHNSNKYRQDCVKKQKCLLALYAVVEGCRFHCHAEKILNVSATVLRIACKRKASGHVMVCGVMRR